MKTVFLALALAGTLLAASTHAQQGPAGIPGAHEIAASITSDLSPAPVPPKVLAQQRQRAEIECAEAKSVDSCVAKKMAISACQNQSVGQRQACIDEERQKFDCSKTRDPQRCVVRKQAFAACKGESGIRLQQCVQSRTPAVDCSKAADPARCERFEKARVVCKDKSAREHRQCLRDTLVPKK